MTSRSARWKNWFALGFLAALAAFFGVGWRLEHRAQSEKLQELESRIETLSPGASAASRRDEIDDLTRFIDESYTLLYDAGFHIQLDLKTDEDGRIRLSADSAKLTEELKVKLRELDQLHNSAPPNN